LFGYIRQIERVKTIAKKFKFQTTSVGGKKFLHQELGIPVKTVSFKGCLQSFVDFLGALQDGSKKIIFIGHNSATFDTPVLLRIFQQYSPQLIQKLMEVHVCFTDSLVLIRNLIKDKHKALKMDDGSYIKTNQAAVYKHLFASDFKGHDALEDVKALNKILFKSSLRLSRSTIVNKSNTVELKSAIEEMNYLDNGNTVLKSFDEVISGQPHKGVMKKSLAKKLADSGIGYNDLERLFKAYGEQGLLAILVNPPTTTNTSARHSRGTTDPLALNLISDHFKGL